MVDVPTQPREVLAAIRERTIAVAGEAWADLGARLAALLPEPLDPIALLPIAAGRAFGGAIESLVRVAAAVVLSEAALRIVDDCADDDDPRSLARRIGVGPAVNMASALHAAAGREFWRLGVADPYFAALLEVCQGQQQDMRGAARTLQAYEAVVLRKTVRAYEFAAAVGARVAGGDRAAIARAAACGAHLGWMAQILDDIEALWFPAAGVTAELRWTFPALYGVTLAGVESARLIEVVAAEPRDPAAIRRALDRLEVRPRLMHLALDHRDRALQLLQEAPCAEGAALLSLWLVDLLAGTGWLLADVEP